MSTISQSQIVEVGGCCDLDAAFEATRSIIASVMTAIRELDTKQPFIS